MSSPICAAALAAAMLTLAGCVTGGLDEETRAALRATMESAQELVDLWRERLDAVDGGGSIEIEPIGEVIDLPATATLPAYRGFDEWGYPATKGDATLFKATVLATADIVNDFPRNAKYFSIVTGQTAFDNPQETEGWPLGRGRSGACSARTLQRSPGTRRSNTTSRSIRSTSASMRSRTGIGR